MAVTVLASILGTMVVVGLVFGVVMAFRANAVRKAADRELLRQLITEATDVNKSLEEHKKSLDKYFEGVTGAVDPLKCVPLLVEGIKKIAAAEVIEISLLRKEVRELKSLIFKKENALSVPGDDDKSIAWELQRMLRDNPGMGREEAMQKVIEEMAVTVGASDEFNLG